MTNGGKDVKIGHDKRPISIIPDNKQPLYSYATGQKLTDEYGNELLVETDTYNLKDQGKDRSTPIVFPSEEDTYNRIEYTTILNDYVISWSAGTNLVTFAAPSDAAGIVTTGDKLSGVGIPDGTIFTGGRSGSGGYRISNNLEGNVGSRTIDVLRRTNAPKKSDPAWRIEEQFAETSEVSSTLLGVNRAELQLSLFSDVSSYGLDNEEFIFTQFSSGISNGQWDQRVNEIYGKRYLGKVIEETSESSIKLGALPVSHTFPFPPATAELGWYNETFYNQYIKFINLGNDLYDWYSGPNGAAYPSTWTNQFLNRATVDVDSSIVRYKASTEASFAAVDVWTETWRSLLKQELKDPITNQPFLFASILDLSETFKDSYPTATDIRPGYADARTSYSLLESRRVFRYQPGRISGFTFGVRASTESVSGYNIEWGIGNPTDHYVFKIRQGNLFIVRRSTVPLNASALARSGLSLTDQTYEVSGDPLDTNPITGDKQKYYTIEVPQDNFNGDALNGNGPSGYGVIAKNVTMWKIEFGWYGAIGCRFYAYIPVGSGEARWVVVHTFVIENSLNQPCLQDSYFKLRYSLHIFNTADIRTPQYLYKYGSSYYIDGGDEGTQQINSSSSGNKIVNTVNEETLLGMTCKDLMVNSAGQEIENKRSLFPISATITSDCLAEIRVQRCKACPGFGHVYTPGLKTGVNGRYVNVAFLDATRLVAIDPVSGLGTSFHKNDDGAKFIAPTIWNAYAKNLSSPDGDGGYIIAQTWGYSGSGGAIAPRNIADDSLYYDSISNTPVSIPSDVNGSSVYVHQVRLSNWNDAIVSSATPLTGSEITIQFLNPDPKDDYVHYADFAIGVTNIVPDIDPATPTVLDGWNLSGISTTILPDANILFDYHSHNYSSIDINGVERGEVHGGQNPNPNMEIDFRIPTVGGIEGGTCSKVVITVQNPEDITNLEQITTNPETGISGKYYLRKLGAFPSGILFTNGEVVIESNGVLITTLTFFGEPISYMDGNTQKSYIEISGDITPFTGGSTSNITIKIRPMRLKSSSRDVTKLYNYNPYPLYFVAKLGDNANINNISIKEKIGDFTRTISPIYALGNNVQLTNASNRAETDGSAPTNFLEIDRLSSAIIDNQNTQRLRTSELKDVFYVGENSTKKVDMTKVFGPNKITILPTNNNIEATFFTAKKIKGVGNGNIQMSVNYGEQ